jgi:gamma-glutamyltranspeptidase/glutathione hydrolase
VASFERVGLIKRSCASSCGIIVTKHPIATSVGRDVLATGGNAYDAAIAASFALAVVEPYMSGIGGVGLALVSDRDGMAVLDGGPVAPRDLDLDRFRPVGDGRDTDLFGWPRVVDDANILGPSSVCVPTMVAMMAALHDRGASRTWSDLLAPAVALARDGFQVDWLLTLSVAQDQANLRSFPSTAAVFFPDDRVPAYNVDSADDAPFRQQALARTLQTIAGDGWRAFYQGEVGRALARAVRSDGGYLSEADLGSYRLRISRPLQVNALGADIRVPDGLNGGPTMAEMLYLYDALRPNTEDWGDPPALSAWVRAASTAFHDRFASMGHAAGSSTVGMRRHARSRLESVPRPIPAGAPDGSTTYLAVADSEGRLVSMNLTLLSGWGSRYVAPDTGVLLNNGIMWFDPVAGRPNSLAPGARPLANMAPLIATRDGNPVLAMGASGGRRIISALPQIACNVFQHGMTVQEAVEAPRLEFSVDPMAADSRFPDSTVREVERLTGKPLQRHLPRLGDSGFASALGLWRSEQGLWTAGMDPTGMAVSACV